MGRMRTTKLDDSDIHNKTGSFGKRKTITDELAFEEKLIDV